MELKRLESSEMSAQKSARKKLPRHHSDSCILGMSQQPQLVSGNCDTDLHSGVREDRSVSRTNEVSTNVMKRNILQAANIPDKLKTEKVRGSLHKSNILKLPFSGKEFRMSQKLVKVAPFEVPPFPPKKYQVALTSRDPDCSSICNLNTSSNDDAGAKSNSQSTESPSVSNMAVPAVSNEGPFIGTTVAKPLHLKPLLQCIPSSSHMKVTDGDLHNLDEVSAMNVGSNVPKVLFVKKGTILTELKLPALTQCHVLPNNNSGVLISNGIGDSMSVPTLPIVPEQTRNSAGSNAAGTLPVAKLYQAVQIGSVLHLVPLCNNSLSHVKH
jgi:hypothetical protein